MSKIIRFRIFSNTDEHQFQMARQNSDSDGYFCARLLAYLFHRGENTDFGGEACQGDEPAVSLFEADSGKTQLNTWVEVNLPSLKKLKSMRSQSRHQIVYLYQNHRDLDKRLKEVNHFKELTVYRFEPERVKAISALVEDLNEWYVESEGDNLQIQGEVIKRELTKDED